MATVFVPVTDQDRALEFYVDKLGFEKRADFRYGRQSRWVEVAPRGSANALALVPPDEGRAPAREDARCAFVTDDIEADHAAMQPLPDRPAALTYCAGWRSRASWSAKRQRWYR